MRELSRLKEWLYHQRSNVRMEKDRAERREKREEAEAQREAEQPALFEFRGRYPPHKGPGEIPRVFFCSP